MEEEKFSICETSTAGPETPWHLRKLSSVGPKYGGGADTPALCGRIVAWDLPVVITQHHLNKNTCTKCRVVYEQ